MLQQVIKARLLLAPRGIEQLKAAMEEYNRACNTLSQLAFEQGGELAVSGSVARRVPQGGAVTRLRLVELPQLLAERAERAVGGGKIRPEVSYRTISLTLSLDSAK